MGQPSDPDALLACDVGDWDAQGEVRRNPEAAPESFTGLMTRRLVGRWMVLDYRTSSGYQGHGVYGWDRDRRRYVGVWIDAMQPAMVRSEGDWDEATRTITYDAVASAGQTSTGYREVNQWLDEDTRLYRHVIPTPDGREIDLVRTVFRRRTPG